MSAKIIQYDLICESFNNSLKSCVNEAIQDGWEPIGGIAFNKGNHYVFSYCQAMVKREVSENEKSKKTDK
jgi:hypothetical protein